MEATGNSIRTFFDALSREESRFLPRLAADSLGVDLRCAVNELNWAHYLTTRSQDLSFDERERYYILQIGITRLIYHSFTSREAFDAPVVLFPRDLGLSKAVLEIAAALGMIQHGRRVAQRASMGTGTVTLDGERAYVIELPSRLPNDSGHEVEVLDLLIQEARERFANLMNTEEGLKLGVEVRRKLAELVYPWADHFIGYDADPLLDVYFFGLASHQIQLEEGYDSFHYSTRFGGITYQTYILALTFVIGSYMRHEAFAEALVEKDKSIKLENVLTITSEIDGFVADLRDAVNYFGAELESFQEVSLTQARAVFDVLSCGRHSSALVAAPGAPIPLIVQCSDSGFIHCPAGARSEPLRFLLESLRHHFPKEYDRNQTLRESVLQQAIRRILGGSFPGLEFRENLAVKSGGNLLTDIDLVVLERSTGFVFLCQLKHQDPYGPSIHAERTRGEHLVEQTRRWMEAVDAWLKETGVTMLQKALDADAGLSRDRIYKIVIARHFAHQLKETAARYDALYTTIAQLLVAATAASPGGPPSDLAALIGRLREIPELQSTYEHQPESRTSWRIGELKFVTCRRGSNAQG